jgi:oxygen-dependent protoporphyrinogen oxidase
MAESPQESRRVVVVGGGVSGLAAAHRLFELRRASPSNHNLEVVLLEASGRTGGTVRTHRREGFLLEGGPDSFISEKPAALELAKRLGLSDRIRGTNEHNRRSFVVSRGRLRPTPEGFQLLAPSRMLPFLTTDIFTWRGKARMALDLLLPRRKGADRADDESLAAFVRRRFGREALERMAQPMVGGIYTADPESLSLRSTMPRFLDMERRDRSLILSMWRAARASKESARHGRAASGARYSLFLSFDEGTQVLTDALAASLPAGTIRLDTKVESLTMTPADSSSSSASPASAPSSSSRARRWLLKTEAGEALEADAVCLALPAYASARLLRGLDEEIAEELDAIPYASTATVNLAYRRSDIPHALDGFGFVVPFVERRATLACTFSSVKFEGRAPEGFALLRAFVGGALQPEMFALDEGRMTEAVGRDLRELLGVSAPPLFAHVEKWPRSMAQYHLGHAARVARIRASLRPYKTLALCGNAYEGAGLPDCVRAGEAAAESLLDTPAL